jgi:TolB-like protein/Tfp pilus assembly protein PilF
VDGANGIFAELKRRHVWRVAVAYVVASWLIVQVATQILPFFQVPDWVIRFVVISLVIGFPIAVVLAWVYEVTPDGVRRTAPAGSAEQRPEDAHRHVGHKLNLVIISVLVLIVLLLLGNQFLWHKDMTQASDVAMVAPHPSSASPTSAADKYVTAAPAQAGNIPEKSVAVLPFVNEGGKPDEQFFSDGLSQDLITALSQFEALKVINRNSAFQFRESRDSIQLIAQKLRVAHILLGSVQKQGDAVRITATLVNAGDGRVLWSQRYDKPYRDLFALQDAITKSVADALQAKLLTVPGAVIQSDRPPSGNLEAYAAYQHGFAYTSQGTESSARKAIDALNEAIRLDPRYAAAQAQLSLNLAGMATQYLSGAEQRQAYAEAREASRAALALDPNLALAHAVRGYILSTADFNWRGAQAEYQRALQLAPQDGTTMFGVGELNATLGQVQSAVDLTRKALAGDPLHANWYNWLSSYLVALGHLDEAEQASMQAIALQPAADVFHEQLTLVAILRGDAKAALASAQQESDPGWRRAALALASQIGADRRAADAALATLIAKDAAYSPYQIAEVYALRRDPDNTFKWLERAWSARDPGIQYLLSDPFILRYRDDPRFAAFCNKVGLPTTTDAVAMD